jgi:hypothetical protein
MSTADLHAGNDDRTILHVVYTWFASLLKIRFQANRIFPDISHFAALLLLRDDVSIEIFGPASMAWPVAWFRLRW